MSTLREGIRVTDDIVTRLREYEAIVDHPFVMNILVESANEIERLRNWAAYEHAGYCGCAGGDNDCINKAYTTWKKVFGD